MHPSEPGSEWHEADGQHLELRGANGARQPVDTDHQAVSVHLMQKVGDTTPTITLITDNRVKRDEGMVDLTPVQALRLAGMLAAAVTAAR